VLYQSLDDRHLTIRGMKRGGCWRMTGNSDVTRLGKGCRQYVRTHLRAENGREEFVEVVAVLRRCRLRRGYHSGRRQALRRFVYGRRRLRLIMGKYLKG
jgi:hypothetical protein